MFLTFLKTNAPLSSVRVKLTNVESFTLSNITVAKGISALEVSLIIPLMVIRFKFCENAVVHKNRANSNRWFLIRGKK